MVMLIITTNVLHDIHLKYIMTTILNYTPGIVWVLMGQILVLIETLVKLVKRIGNGMIPCMNVLTKT